MELLPSLLAREIIQGLQAYITTGFETPTPHFAGAFRRLVESPGQFHKGPYLSVSLPFQQGDADRNFFHGLDTAYPPYLHQQQAWQRLASDRDPGSTLIATGTGSGKTECFLYPLLDHCARHPGPGVKAIVIYPMNALATDQAKRFASTIHHSPALRGRVRVGLFVGGMEEEPSDRMGATEVITDKDELRKNPPDILLTNYKMLDFLLLRPRDQGLWRDNGLDALRYLVVDELHTFDGAQGTDLACLIRRMKARLLDTGNSLVCVGTSATLGTGDEQHALIHYASQVFQSPFGTDSIIGESRQAAGEFLSEPIEYLLVPADGMGVILSPESYRNPEEYLAAQYRLFFPGQRAARIADGAWRAGLGKQLKRHLLFNNLLRLLVRQPRALPELAQELAETLAAGETREHAPQLLDSFCALIAIARDARGQPLVNLRLQLWVRELRRIVAPLKPDPENRWVAQYLRKRNYDFQIVFNNDNDYWLKALDLTPSELDLPDAFYREEWLRVIQPQSIENVDQYKRASRIGRGTRLNRMDRIKVWPVFAEYRNLLTSNKKREVDDAYRDAAALIAREPDALADFMVDRLEEMVPRWKLQFDLHTLVINADNGPESNGHRTQWLKRLVELSDTHQLTIQLAYYPPYPHSKYNPVERLWGRLENHWRGEIIDTVDKALGLARSMTYRGIRPTVRKVSRTYRKGISVAKKAMRDIEARLERTTGLEFWFIKIVPQAQIG